MTKNLRRFIRDFIFHTQNMNIEGEPKRIEQQPELPKAEIPSIPRVDDSEELVSCGLKAEEEAARKRDEAKIAEVRASLGLEQTEEKGIRIASTGEEIRDFDEALGGFVLDNNPDRIVDQILSQVPNDLVMVDNELGGIKQSIRIWITESAANAARHINCRQTGDDPIQYNIEVFCRIKMMHGGKYLEISMQDNGVGIKPENLKKIGEERFTTSGERKKTAGTLHAGGHGRFSYDFKNQSAHPREWEMSIRNRNDGKQGAISFLTIPLRNVEEYKRAA